MFNWKKDKTAKLTDADVWRKQTNKENECSHKECKPMHELGNFICNYMADHQIPIEDGIGYVCALALSLVEWYRKGVDNNPAFMAKLAEKIGAIAGIEKELARTIEVIVHPDGTTETRQLNADQLPPGIREKLEKGVEAALTHIKETKISHPKVVPGTKPGEA